MHLQCSGSIFLVGVTDFPRGHVHASKAHLTPTAKVATRRATLLALRVVVVVAAGIRRLQVANVWMNFDFVHLASPTGHPPRADRGHKAYALYQQPGIRRPFVPPALVTWGVGSSWAG